MRADGELIKHLQTRYKFKLRMLAKYEPHGDDRFKHILTQGELSGLREIVMILDAVATPCAECEAWGNVCGPDNYPDYVSNPKACDHFIEKSNATGQGRGLSAYPAPDCSTRNGGDK